MTTYRMAAAVPVSPPYCTAAMMAFSGLVSDNPWCTCPRYAHAHACEYKEVGYEVPAALLANSTTFAAVPVPLCRKATNATAHCTELYDIIYI